MTSPRIAFEAAKKALVVGAAVAMTGGLSGCVTTQGGMGGIPNIFAPMGSPVMLGTYHAVNPQQSRGGDAYNGWQLAPNSTATLVHDNRTPGTPIMKLDRPRMQYPIDSARQVQIYQQCNDRRYVPNREFQSACELPQTPKYVTYALGDHQIMPLINCRINPKPIPTTIAGTSRSGYVLMADCGSVGGSYDAVVGGKRLIMKAQGQHNSPNNGWGF